MSAMSKIKSALVRAGKWLAGAVLVVVALIFGLLEQDNGGGTSTPASTPAPAPIGSPGGGSPADVAFAERASDRIMTVEGEVVHVLPDDNEGSRHQRFLLELRSGLTLKISHNIDLAPRVANLRRGTRALVHGEYEWNDKGGVIHWTHHDPKGWREGGWIEYEGRRYE